MEYVILIIVIAVLALSTGGYLLFMRPRRGRTLAPPPRRGPRPAQDRAAHPAWRGHRPVAAHLAPRRPARGGPHGRRERHRQDHHLREARAGADRGRADRAARGGRHLPRGGGRPAA